MIGSLVMMALGAFRFGILGGDYQSFRRSASFRWAEMARVGRQPALQYSGPGTEEITLEGVIYPHFKGGLRQLDLMRLLAGTGQPMMLVDGGGFIWKRWVIVAVEERKTLFMADGAPRKIEFTIRLRSYGGDFFG